MGLRLTWAVMLTLGLGGCVHAVGAARTTLADMAKPDPTPVPVVCPGLEVDGQCEATSLQDIHPASNPVLRSETARQRCPPTVLGIPGWCARF